MKTTRSSTDDLPERNSNFFHSSTRTVRNIVPGGSHSSNYYTESLFNIDTETETSDDDSAEVIDFNPTSGGEQPSFIHTVTRKYTYINRRKSAPAEALSHKWSKQLSNMSDDDIRRKECCLEFSCFRNVDIGFFRTRAHRYFSMSLSERRHILETFLIADGTFHFGGRRVVPIFYVRGYTSSKISSLQ